MFWISPLQRCKKEYRRLIKQKHELMVEEDSQPRPGDELELIETKISELVEGVYAEEVFRYYAKKQPSLIRIHTGEEVTWKDAFGDAFESVSKSLRHSLVGLVEGGGQYTIK